MSTETYLPPSHARAGARGIAAALFASRTQAQGAIQDLQTAGFDSAHVGLALRDRDAQDQLMAETGTHAAEQTETAGQVSPVARPVNDAPPGDFIGTRRLTDADTGSRMTI